MCLSCVLGSATVKVRALRLASPPYVSALGTLVRPVSLVDALCDAVHSSRAPRSVSWSSGGRPQCSPVTRCGLVTVLLPRVDGTICGSRAARVTIGGSATLSSGALRV